MNEQKVTEQDFVDVFNFLVSDKTMKAEVSEYFSEKDKCQSKK